MPLITAVAVSTISCSATVENDQMGVRALVDLIAPLHSSENTSIETLSGLSLHSLGGRRRIERSRGYLQWGRQALSRNT